MHLNLTKFLLAALASGVVASITDWFFMGFLFHERYLENRETFRGEPGKPETGAIIVSSLFGLLASAMFIYLCYWTGALIAPRIVIRVAAVVWLVAPVPIIFTNIIWIKMHPLLGVSHSLGWLARLVLTGLIALWLLH